MGVVSKYRYFKGFFLESKVGSFSYLAQQGAIVFLSHILCDFISLAYVLFDKVYQLKGEKTRPLLHFLLRV